ncbi:MAG: arylformamidase [Parcubacteria group bacterium Gr01-1014_31]|nr:MAG: arylformamidase [Parcubacteria group bacterium Gr01-1014_31]
MARRLRLVDISLPLHGKTVVYPGNPRVKIRTLRGKTSWHSEVVLGSHTGTHVDAPRHAFRDGGGVDRLPLQAFYGPCRVLDLTRLAGAITTTDLAGYRIRAGERVLLKTRNSRRGFSRWWDDYVWLTGEAAAWLAQRRVSLVGIDSLSVKQRGSPDNRPHTALLSRGIPIVEGLDLSKVRPGRYVFIGLPLKFMGLDGAPLRAALLG